MAYSFVKLFQGSWMIETGSQEQLWETEAIFKNEKITMDIQYFNNSIFCCSLIFFSNKSACDFGPSGESRMNSSSFVGILIPCRFFGKLLKLSIRMVVSHIYGLYRYISLFFSLIDCKVFGYSSSQDAR